MTKFNVVCLVGRFPASKEVLIKNLRYLVPIILLGACANDSQAAQQFRQINASKGRVVLSTSATVGGPAPNSGNKKGGTQFPVIPAGALVSQVSSNHPNQQNQLSIKAGTNIQTSAATAPQKLPTGATAGASSQTTTSSATQQQAGTIPGTPVPATNAIPQQQTGVAQGGTSNQSALTPSGASTAQSSTVPQQQKTTESVKRKAGKASAKHSALPTRVFVQSSRSTQPKQ